MKSTKWVHEALWVPKVKSFTDLGPSHSDSIFSNLFSSITFRPIEAKFHVALLWDGEWKWVQMVQVTWPRWPPCPYMVKPSKIFGTKRLMTMKLGMQHLVLKYYELCPNDDPGLPMTIFMTGSNLFPNASIWVKAYTALSAHVFLSLF